MLTGLPEASLSFVTGFLRIRDACSLRHVCKDFRLLRLAMVKLHYSEVRQFEQAMAACVPRSLRALDVHAEIEDGNLVHLRDMTGLVHLDLSWCTRVTQACFTHVAFLTTLKKLDLTGLAVTDDGLEALSTLAELKTLVMHTCDSPPGTTYRALKAFGKLETLTLTTNRVLKDDALAAVGELKTLTHLDVNCSPHLTAVGLAHLAQLTSLKSLNLGACRLIASKDLAEVANFAKLETLNLRRCALVSGTSKLASLVNLQRLNLEQTSIFDESLAHFNSSLRELNISTCPIGDLGLAHLSCLTNLRKLEMGSCDFTDAGLQHLTPLVRVWHLNISWCTQVTDAGLVHVSAMKSLSELHLRGVRGVTCAGVGHLAQLPHLKHLDLRACARVADQGLKRALKSMHLTYLDLRDTRVTKQCADQLSRVHEIVMSY